MPDPRDTGTAAIRRTSVTRDASERPKTTDGIAADISAALRTQNLRLVTEAIGAAAKARGMKYIASESGLSREGLYKALSGAGNPEFETILRVLEALGLQLQAEPASVDQRQFK
jgi:probable addiction module antidote protein